MLDRQLALHYCDEDEEMLEEMLLIFAGTKERKEQEIRSSMAEGNWKNFTAHVHALKSSALSIGGKDLSDAAARLEDAGKKQDLDYIGKHCEEVLHLYDRTAAEAERIAEN